MTLAVLPFLSRKTSPPSAAAADLLSGTFSSGFLTRYLMILRSIFMALTLRSRNRMASELAVVTFLDGVVQIRGAVDLAVVLDLLIPLGLDLGAILEGEHVRGVLEIVFLHQHALEGLRIEAEGGAALQPLLVRVEIDVLELLVLVVGRHIRRLGDRGVDPLLRGSLDVHVLPRSDLIRGGEVVGQLLPGAAGPRHGLGIHQLPVRQQLEGVDVYLLLRLAARADDVAEVVM